MTLEIQFLALNKHNHVADLNLILGSQTPDNWISNAKFTDSLVLGKKHMLEMYHKSLSVSNC